MPTIKIPITKKPFSNPNQLIDTPITKRTTTPVKQFAVFRSPTLTPCSSGFAVFAKKKTLMAGLPLKRCPEKHSQ